MRLNSSRLVFVALVLTAASWTACTQTEKPAAETASAKVPITTKSEEARKEFLTGRDLSEKLQAQDSLAHFDKATSLDPDFAQAHLARALASPTAKEFFEHLHAAVAVADKASEGERLLIMATQEAANGDTAKQKADLEKVVATYPNDERAHVILGVFYFGQQDFPQAIEQLKKATEIAPDHSPAYNMLGYSYRQAGDYTNAEQAFKKYAELIPNDPNPYDSYAELLLKMGRFDEAIQQYRKALSIDPNFLASHFGITGALTYEGKPAEAKSELQMITDKARSDGDRRLALFGLTVVDTDSGKLQQALTDLDKQYAIGEKSGDAAGMAGDLQNKGTLLVAMQKYDDAAKAFDGALKAITDSNLSQQVKDNAAVIHHYSLATVAIGKKDFAAAKMHADEFAKGAVKNPVQVKQSHELDGMIAMAQKDYDKAISELEQANQQNPENLYRLCQAYVAKGDKSKAQDYCGQAASFNSLPQLNYALVRAKAQKIAGKKS